MKRTFLKIISAVTAAVLLLCGCSNNNEAPENVERRFSYGDLDYALIADNIYDEISVDSLTMGSVSKVEDETVLTEQYYLELNNLNGYEVRSAEGKFGVADVAILWVKEDCGNAVMDSLQNRKDDRIAEFIDYNVYNSYETAVNADIYQEGELVVMLMLNDEDKAIAKGIIDSYLLEHQL